MSNPIIQFAERESRGAWRRAAHLEVLADELAAVAGGMSDRLLIRMPPRHGKSELFSRRFMTWYRREFPSHDMIESSAAGKLALKYSRLVRSDCGLETTGTADLWRTEAGGEFLAVGVGCETTGFGAHLFGIDDVVPDPTKARSDSWRDTCRDWFGAVSESRLAPQAAIVICAATWPGDLGEWLLTLPEAPQWRVVRMPALDSQDRPLWPERYSGDVLKRKRDNYYARGQGWIWESLYQQQPRGFSDAAAVDWPDPETLRPRIMLVTANPPAIYWGGKHAGRWWLTRHESTDLIGDLERIRLEWHPERIYLSQADYRLLRRDLALLMRRVLLPPLFTPPCPAVPQRLLGTSRIICR